MRPISVLAKPLHQTRAMTIGTLILLFALPALADPVAIPTPTEQAVAYHNVSNVVWGVNQFLTLLLLPISLLFLGSRAWISTKLKHGKYLKFVLLATGLFTLGHLVQFPLDRIRTNDLNQINNDTGLPIMQWILGEFLQALPPIVISSLLALLVYWLINKSPGKWWLWAAGVFSFGFLVFLVVEPYTISYKPLGQRPIEIKVSALADEIGIPSEAIVLEDCEPFDSCEIAHVSGLGPTRRILLNKGLFDAYPDSWTLQTFAHESKHYIKDDNLVGWAVFTLILLVFFFLSDRICRVIVQRFSKQMGFNSISQPLSLPLLILVLNVIYLVALPPINLFRQHVEFEADRYGLALTGQNEVLAEMVSSWTTASRHRVPDPSLFFMLFRSSHPSDAERISFANEFQPKDTKE